MEMMSVHTKNMRQNAVDSPRNIMPASTVNTAPMPPQTA